MNEVLDAVSTAAPEDQNEVLRRVVDVGTWIGRREAFGLIAGRCAAADVECLRRLRDERKYRDLTDTWPDFCARYLKVSRRTVDRQIAHLEEFGPQFFHLTKLTHITVNEYRQIASFVGQAGLEVNGSVVALLPENSGQLETALAELLESVKEPEAPKALEAAPPAVEPPTVERIVERCREAARMLRELGPTDRGQADAIAVATGELISAARESGYMTQG